MINVQCNGKNLLDCQNCNLYYSFHSLHYDTYEKKKIIEINCCFGGNKDFDEDGNLIYKK